ncbi:hypothetical protein Bpfe_025590 [Biomphalaria pfeifferi]|uniref:Uncharacterized protein n=1 Tax=Biomphalaria pfeifferi TaxID=112525 RepID=A0AAD8AZ30_BIOPF|nr:hypothetical protein Bpfe_025590 [Biomphalaria pfeifferi]
MKPLVFLSLVCIAVAIPVDDDIVTMLADVEKLLDNAKRENGSTIYEFSIDCKDILASSGAVMKLLNIYNMTGSKEEQQIQSSIYTDDFTDAEKRNAIGHAWMLFMLKIKYAAARIKAMHDRGQTLEPLFGKHVFVLNRIVKTMLDGLLNVPVLNSELVPVLNSELVHVLNSELVHVLNSELVPALNSALVPALNSALVPSLNSELVPSLNSELVPYLNSAMVPALNSELVPSLNSALVPSLNSELVPFLNSELVPALNSELVPFLNSELVPSLNSELVRLISVD